MYPPTTYALLGPLGALSWPAARGVWVGLSLGSLLAIGVWVRAWLRASRPAWAGRLFAGRPGMWWLLPLGLALMPVHTTLRFGQLGLVVLALCVWAIGTPRRGTGGVALPQDTEPGESGWSAMVSGLMLAVAGGLKPQLAGLFALGLLLTGRWRTVAWCAAWGLGVVAVAVGRWMLPDGTALGAWWSALRDNLDAFAGQGFADPRPTNAMAHQMIHLEPLVWRIGDGLNISGGPAFTKVAAASGLVVTAIASVWMMLRLRGRRAWEEQRTPSSITLWVASVAATLTLLIAYHRAYDAVLLVVPAVWACLAWGRGARWSSVFVGGAVLLYLVRWPEIAAHLIGRGVLPWDPSGVAGWHVLFMHQGTWALLAIAATLLMAGPDAGSVTKHPPAAPRSTATPG